MRNLTATICLTFVFLNPSKLLAESYICSHELSRFGRAGEVETQVYKRTGNHFWDNTGYLYKILSETPVHLILYWGHDDAGKIVLMNKNTKEWDETFFSMDEFKKHPPDANTFAKCMVMD